MSARQASNIAEAGKVPASANIAQSLDAAKLTRMATALRALAIDAVEAANSGHPGLPLGAADIATVLFAKFLKFDATEPAWPDRDRFVLSAGHGSMLLYGLLHLLGYEGMRIEDIRRFRQLGSRAAGHPEHDLAAGIETTTGPLGQGLANAVGMAIAERHLAATFGETLVDHHTYVLASDGDLMEGISHEAISLAGHLKLSKLIVLFDDNGISIDGPTALAESGDQIARFQAAGWDATRVDGHDMAAIGAAIEAAKASDQPSLIACRTTIGFGAPHKQGTAGVHGAPLGSQEATLAKIALGWEHPPFEIPSDIRDAWRLAGLRGVKKRKAWEKRLAKCSPEIRGEFERRTRGDLPARLGAALVEHKKRLLAEPKAMASRKASQMALEVINPLVPETVGGSADLTGSNNTKTETTANITAEDFSGRFIHYGVREHVMAAAMNGMALHGGVIPYSGTFLVFSDYCRPAIRLSALMQQRVIYVMTHDSIGLGEDGPTHQPVEHLAALRAMPNLWVLRPADAIETAECWQLALERRDGPCVLALSRQNLPQLRTNHADKNPCARGAYIIAAASKDAKVTLIATGSEVAVALAAREALETERIPTAVVSMPCWELFEAQGADYRNAVINPDTVRVSVEAAATLGWSRYVGDNGIAIGLNSFGASAPYQDLYGHFGITAEAVAAAARARLLETAEEDGAASGKTKG
ncbi:MAG TPA: transketolase [Hyphomicrobiales bacterium]|nr:transketolase [Hyphomicrobiales bacterium]